MSATALPERAHFDLDDARDVYEHLHELDTHYERVVLMQEHLPDWSRHRVERAMPLFMVATPDRLLRVIQHADPTGEKATSAVIRDRGY